jgi:AraC-like DNA-binding protein
MLMEPGETHANTSVQSPGTFFALFVASEQIDQLLECSETRRPHFKKPVLEYADAQAALKQLHATIDTEDAEAQEQHLCLALTTVLGASAEREVVVPRVSGRKLRLGLHSLGERYRAQPWKTVDVREVAAELSVSYHWFVHSFRREFGLAPYQFVKALRVSSARSLMSRGPNDTVRTLGDIAFQVGYADAAHMHREFKRDCGLKPSTLAAALNPTWQRVAPVATARPTIVDCYAPALEACGNNRSTAVR